MIYKNILLIIAMLTTVSAQGAIGLDRTRAIFDGDKNSISLNISNESKTLPYLAQAWLEDENGKKITEGALVVTPPVQRLEPGQKSMIRVSSVASKVKSLPQDRESIFYFNLREIPPRSEKPNVLQIALQTKIKLFYRPSSVIPQPNYIWQKELVLHKTGNGYRIENPTPFYITIIGLGETKKSAELDQFEAVMVSPKSSISVPGNNSSAPYLTYIDDYGGRPTLSFSCTDNKCTVKE